MLGLPHRSLTPHLLDHHPLHPLTLSLNEERVLSCPLLWFLSSRDMVSYVWLTGDWPGVLQVGSWEQQPWSHLGAH